MQYILLIYENEAEAKTRNPEEGKRIFAEYGALTGAIKQSGQFRAGEPLQPTSTATTVRVKAGKTVRTDGPFAETREQLGGFYIVDAKDLDEAVGIAARIPTAKTGSIEVRPIMMMNAM
ncbi:MAG TPA: YciI family protein [Polyangiaceae bacterium]|nr:YciI family protein [Polyangiaceae bacterium]